MKTIDPDSITTFPSLVLIVPIHVFPGLENRETAVVTHYNNPI